jgi:eukaryotic-like serine/threonine-protein kinase
LSATLLAGRYRVVRRLGSGAMAVVELAEDMQLERPVAIKLLRAGVLEDRDLRARFVREARAAARLSHPNVVGVFDTGATDGRPFIVMEYVPGETLAAVLERRRTLPPAEVVDLGVQACAGLAEAHDHGLVHRDVKPQNLIVREDGILKIADFGIVRGDETTRLTQHGTVLGTAGYLSPEQAAGEDVTAASDLYALGAVLYELLTGRTPYEFESLTEFAATQWSRAVTPVRDIRPDVPEALEAVVMRCLARDARFRYGSAAELRSALRASLEPRRDHTAPMRRLPARPTARLPGVSRVSWVVGAALVIAVTLLALGLSRLGGNGTGPRAKGPAAPTIAALPRGATPAAEARNLSAWLRASSQP